MEKKEKKGPPLSSTINSGNEIKTVYINDIESLNDSTENNEINFNYYALHNEKLNSGIIRGKFSHSSKDANYLTNKLENVNFKISSLNKLSKIKANKEKKEKSQKRSNKKEKIKNHKKFKFISSKYSDELDRTIINKLKNENNLLEKNELDKFSYNNENENENEVIKSLKNKYKDNTSLNINLIRENEIGMVREIEFLKKEIILKNNIIQKLIEENKNLMEKIKIKEIELLDSKNKEESLTKVIQENNKCITNLNDLILRLIPKKEIENENKINKIQKYRKISKIENNCIPRKKSTKASAINKKINDNENFDKNNHIYSDIHLGKINRKIYVGNPVQRYFKIHHTRNSIKKYISLNHNNKIYNIENDNMVHNKYLNLNSIEKKNKSEKSKRNNTISIDMKRHNNNNYSYFINDTINYPNNQLIKSLTKNNIYKNNRYNIELLEDNNNNDINLNYYKGNISCKNENIDKHIDISPKKFESNSNLSINDIFTFSNKYNKYKLTSPKLAYKNINDTDLDRSYNYKYLKNLNFSFKGSQKPLISKLDKSKILYLKDNFISNNRNEQSFSIKNNSNKFSNFIIIDNLINERNNYYSPRNKDVKAFEKK